MQTGIRLKAHPTEAQRLALSQWIGCARAVWNAKCDEHEYLSTYARKYMPIGTYAPHDQTYSQFKDRELTPWLFDVPSQVLRNSAVNWFATYRKFLKGECGRPRRKKRKDRGSVHLTRELFRFERGDDGVLRLFLGTKTNDLGQLVIGAHRPFGGPNSIRIVRDAGEWFVSFSYETGRQAVETEVQTFEDPEDQLAWLRGQGRDWLEANVAGHDRGVVIPVCSADAGYDFTPGQKRAREREGKKQKRLQRRLARQRIGSKRRQRTKGRLARSKLKDRNVRRDFCHKTSRKIVDGPALLNVFEDLRLKGMTRRAKPKVDDRGRFVPNGAAAKSGLNRALLGPSLGQVVEFARYKSARAGKLLLLVPPHHTSQECASCGHVDPDSRRTQATFECTSCGHRDNADHNAAVVIGKRAVTMILDPGTGLSARGVLSKDAPRSGTGRGAEGKTGAAKPAPALGDEASKEKRTADFLAEAA